MNNSEMIPRFLGVSALAMFTFTGIACQNSSDSNTGAWAGATPDYPFDSDGNYIEAVALGQRPSSRTSSPPPPPPYEPPPYETTIASTPSISPSTPSTPPPPPPVVSTTPPPAPTPPSTPAASTTTHTVKSGDTLWGLSRQYNTSVQAIKNANSLTSDLIRVGQTLQIPR